jgi:hypothetical protein
MVELVTGKNLVRIATLKTIQDSDRGQGSSGLESPLTKGPDPETEKRYNHVLDKLEAETMRVGPNVMVAVSDADASMLQSRIAEGGEAGPPLPAGGIEAQFGEGLTGGDLWGWMRSVFDHVSNIQWHPIVRPPDTKAEPLRDRGRIAVVGDWGTNLYGAPVSAESITRIGGFEMLMHLGDVYYSGTEKEINDRFLSVWPLAAARVSRALNGNHEMYSGGGAYFDHVLPAFGQRASYFAAQNANWLLVGLDTAHTDHGIDTEQVAWLETVAAQAGPRRIILFSHHQPFSRLDKQGPLLQQALSELFRRRAITAWYWGHEHNCILYDRHPGWGFLGRCIGHGGIPAPRKKEVMEAPTEQQVDSVAWHRLEASAEAPSCLVLDGPNPLVPGEEEKFGPHGYLVLDFDGPTLIERVHLPDGTEIFKALVA